jgi:hypothetical protein
MIALGLLAVLAWQSLDSIKEPAIASATFAEGFKVEIVRAELTSKLIHKPFRFVTWTAMSEGIRYARSSLFFSTKETNGRLSEASFEHQSRLPCLSLLLRAYRPDGTAFTSDHFIADEGLDLLRVKRKGTRLIGYEEASGTSALGLCQLLVEVEDGAGGWLPFCGPVFADTRDAHALALRSPFPRTSPTLRLRFQNPGQSPVETSIPNPGYRSSFPSLEPESLPAVRESDRFRLELTQLRRNASHSAALNFTPIFKIGSKPPLHLDKPATDIRVEDMQGNPIFYSNGYTLLPGHKLVRLHYTLRPQAGTFPWNAADVTFIASGLWDETGKMARAEITSDGHQLGFHKLTLSPSVSKAKHRKTNLPPIIDLKIEGAGDAAMWARLQALSPKNSVAIFSDESLSFGSMNDHGLSWGSRAGARHWTANSSWSGSPKPGSVFRVALVPETKSDEFEFIVDLSTAQPK